MSDPKIAQKSPFVMEVEPGKYAWCSCGLSTKQPYCDGSHKGTGFAPIIENVTEARKVAWCGCKRSGKAPFCDGSHSKIE
jgi:CDGSH-type Zn-finger protein